MSAYIPARYIEWRMVGAASPRFAVLTSVTNHDNSGRVRWGRGASGGGSITGGSLSGRVALTVTRLSRVVERGHDGFRSQEQAREQAVRAGIGEA